MRRWRKCWRLWAAPAYLLNRNKASNNYSLLCGKSLKFISGELLSVLVYVCWNVDIQVTRGLYLFLVHVLEGNRVGGKCWLLCQSCAVSKITIQQAEGIINRGALERHSHKYKEERKGGRGDRLNYGFFFVVFIVHKSAPSATALAHPADPLFFPSEKTLFVSFHGDKHTASWQLSKAFCKWHLLLDLLSRCLFITTTETFTQLFTMFRERWQAEKSYKLCLSHLISLNVYCGPYDAWLNPSHPLFSLSNIQVHEFMHVFRLYQGTNIRLFRLTLENIHLKMYLIQ